MQKFVSTFGNDLIRRFLEILGWKFNQKDHQIQIWFKAKQMKYRCIKEIIP